MVAIIQWECKNVTFPPLHQRFWGKEASVPFNYSVPHYCQHAAQLSLLLLHAACVLPLFFCTPWHTAHMMLHISWIISQTNLVYLVRWLWHSLCLCLMAFLVALRSLWGPRSWQSLMISKDGPDTINVTFKYTFLFQINRLFRYPYLENYLVQFVLLLTLYSGKEF